MTIVHDNFVNILQILESLGIDGVDGIMADLGVSSHQLDTDERGFSFHKDAPLDMRMSMEGMSAADLVNTASQSELQKIIYTYGEEKFAPSIAKNIVKAREQKPIETTFELVDIIKASMPMKAKRDGHPARRTFQALRIEVNGELDKLERALDDMFEALNPSGRIAIITFHSLEDRIVKGSSISSARAVYVRRNFRFASAAESREANFRSSRKHRRRTRWARISERTAHGFVQ